MRAARDVLFIRNRPSAIPRWRFDIAGRGAEDARINRRPAGRDLPENATGWHDAPRKIAQLVERQRVAVVEPIGRFLLRFVLYVAGQGDPANLQDVNPKLLDLLQRFLARAFPDGDHGDDGRHPENHPSIVSSERSLWLHSSRNPVFIGAVNGAKLTFTCVLP